MPDDAEPNTTDRFLTTRVDAGGGLHIEVQRRNLEVEEDWCDPCFFDEGYSVAAATAFSRVWEGGMVLIDLIRGELRGALKGRRIVELGAGTGLAGMCAAAAGAHVLLTDVPSVVEEEDCGLRQNIARNGAGGGGAAGGSGKPWAGAAALGQGTVAAAALDWEKSLEAQGIDAECIEVVIAAECVWLKDLVTPFVATVLTLLHSPARPTCFMASVDRSKPGSATFASLSEVTEKFKGAGCDVELIHRRPSLEDPGKDTCVWAIKAKAKD